MAYHPINLGLRFALEIITLGALAWWGRTLTPGWAGLFLACLLPLIAATLWGVFRFPEEAGRSGKVPVPVPGWLRLTLELIYFGLAIWAFRAVGARGWSLAFTAIVIAHYATSWNRLALMLRPLQDQQNR